MMPPAYIYKAVVARVVDGDTVDLVVDLGFRMTTQQRIRLALINTPERGQAGFDAATKRLYELLPVGSEVRIKTAKADLYGRYIAEIATEMYSNVGAILLAEGWAVPYKPRITT